MIGHIFVDASAWIAVISADDSNHGGARVIWREIVENDWPLLTTNWTLYEALTFLKKRSLKLCEQLWAVSQPGGSAVEILTVSRDNEEAALRTFLQHRDKTWSVVDCANFHAIREKRCKSAFAYDDDFRQASGEFGFRLLE